MPVLTEAEVLDAGARRIHSGLSWTALAEELGVSPTALSQRFKRLTSKNYKSYDQARSRRSGAYRRKQVRDLVAAAKAKPCTDCGIELPAACMDLDHVNGTKEFTLAKAYGGGSGAYRTLEAIQREIDKCEVRCANCHRLRHYEAAA